jgi:hypothetical protein
MKKVLYKWKVFRPKEGQMFLFVSSISVENGGNQKVVNEKIRKK